MQVFAKTDIGRERKTNEDFYYISEPEDKIKLFILADGMGGYNAGEVASKMAVETVKDYIYKHFEKSKESKEKLEQLLKDAIEYAKTFTEVKINEYTAEINSMIKSISDISNISRNMGYVQYEVPFTENVVDIPDRNKNYKIKPCKVRESTTSNNDKYDIITLNNYIDQTCKINSVSFKCDQIPYDSVLMDANGNKNKIAYTSLNNPALSENKPSSLNIPCYWFERSTSVVDTNSKGYHHYGGTGWKILNPEKGGSETSDGVYVPSYQSNYYSISVNKKDVYLSKKYKCVVVYNGVEVSAETEIQKVSSKSYLKIESLSGTNKFDREIGTVFNNFYK